jgi:hypothetical protein
MQASQSIARLSEPIVLSLGWGFVSEAGKHEARHEHESSATPVPPRPDGGGGHLKHASSPRDVNEGQRHDGCSEGVTTEILDVEESPSACGRAGKEEGWVAGERTGQGLLENSLFAIPKLWETGRRVVCSLIVCHLDRKLP